VPRRWGIVLFALFAVATGFFLTGLHALVRERDLLAVELVALGALATYALRRATRAGEGGGR
jgi:hypothetical protein